jgi:YebC/PmpR family DNA-binding regulatory protein
MAGHSKWNNIKRTKGANDAKRAKIFTKLLREIQVAARQGSTDPKNNPRLRMALQEAKAHNVPKENMDRALARGTGQESAFLEECLYEGYGPGGVAFLIESFTDNKNRTVADVREVFSRHGGSLAEAGSVTWMFEKKGVFSLKKDDLSEDNLLRILVEVGVEDFHEAGETWDIETSQQLYLPLKDALERNGLTTIRASLEFVPKTSVPLDIQEGKKILDLIEALENLDDVQKVSSNFDLDEKTLQSFAVTMTTRVR